MLLSIFERSALFFPRLDKLEDPFEGYYTKSVLGFDKLKFDDLSPELRTQIPDEHFRSPATHPFGKNAKG